MSDGNGSKEEEANQTPSQDNESTPDNAVAAEEKPPNEMKAVVLSGFGGLKSIKIMKKPEPVAAEGEVLIRVKACGLNFQDLMMRQGVIDSPAKTPFILGVECAGEVVAVGEGVDQFQEGDSVSALAEARAWAELVSVPAKFVYRMPSGMTFTDAAALTLPYAVAHVLLFELGGLTPGKKLLLHSAGGAVGQAVAQLCKTVADVTVIGLASKSKHDAIKDSLNHVFERGSDYVGEIKKHYPDGVDIVLDCLGGEECNKGYSLLKPMGKYILYGSSSIVTGETKSFFSVAKSWWQVDKISPIKLFDDNKSLTGFNLRHLLYQQNGSDFVRQTVEKTYRMWGEGNIKPVVDSVWAFEDVAMAMQKIHDRLNVGKIILDPNMEPKPKPTPPPKSKAAKNDEKEKKEDKKEEDKKEEKSDKPNDEAVADASGDAAPESKPSES